MKVDIEIVKQIREKTSASVIECKKALEEAGGDAEKALDILKKRGLLISQKKAHRETKEGLIGAYIHTNGKVGVLIEVNTESDFVARNEEFKELVKNLTLQIAASDPKWVDKESIPQDILEQEKQIYREQFKDKPPAVIEKIVEGKMDDFYKANVLLEQSFVKDENITVKEYINSKIAKVGENIRVRRFVKYELGE
ncbi:MAG: elongation factor Ts [Candidatus Omnitrophica bacterium]|nr:elongation factor Ts [Candidatus Omnitrophota bacterium]MCM8777044.1 elongation factor Ts [Candidatus Omnitrophota bacterium]